MLLTFLASSARKVGRQQLPPSMHLCFGKKHVKLKRKKIDHYFTYTLKKQKKQGSFPLLESVLTNDKVIQNKRTSICTYQIEKVL